MQIQIDCGEGSISTAHITLLQRRLGLVLPDEYRQFVLRHNGGRPSPAYFPYVEPERGPEKTGWARIRRFLAVTSKDPALSIEGQATFRTVRTSMSRFVPIAELEFMPPLEVGRFLPEGLLLLSCAEQDSGHVVLWSDPMRQPDDRNFCELAPSFNALLDDLQYPKTALPWMPMIDQNDSDGIRRWLGAGPDLQKWDDVTLRTPLAHAASQGRLEIVSLLIEHQADFSEALIHAVVAGHTDIAELIIERGADVSEAFYDAVMSHHTSAAKLLLPFGVNADRLKAARRLLRDLVSDGELEELIQQELKQPRSKK
jgi:hypothetical protein